jgi:beta-lactamase regulating signal transducer with metallopeptidase domain/protocatechuate 3,4-dioxygenase beta subunit
MAVLFSRVQQAVTSMMPKDSLTQFAVVVCVQATLLTLLAVVLAKVCKRDPNWSHRIWLSCVLLFLALPMAHWFIDGWPVRLESPAILSVIPARPAQVTLADITDKPTVKDYNAGLVWTKTPDKTPKEAASSSSVGTSTSFNTQLDAAEVKARSKESNTTPVSWLHLGVVLYLAVATIMLVRLVVGMWRLRDIAKNGTVVSTRTQVIFADATRCFCLSRIPSVRVVEGLSMPLTYGVWRGQVLVPSDFDTWSESERRAVAMHELAHVRRNDVVCELATRIMCAIYWFHPTCWFVAKYLKQTRELATDQFVVDVGGDASSYARSLVAILSRVSIQSGRRIESPLPVVAMAAIGDVEERVRALLLYQRAQSSRLRGRIFVGFLLALAVVTSIRLEFAIARVDELFVNEPTSELVASGQEAKETKPNSIDNSESSQLSIDPGDNDLYQRMVKCEVLNVTGDDYEAQWDVDGQVLTPEGTPVEGAVVLLRESSIDRYSSESMKSPEFKGSVLSPYKDVFARTTTDSEGRFKFRDVKSSSVETEDVRYWRGNVVVGHPKYGMGWYSILTRGKSSQKRSLSALQIQLLPTGSITCNCVNEEKVPVKGATVAVHGIESLELRTENSEKNLSLEFYRSQLSLRTESDSGGLVTFSGLPNRSVASTMASNGTEKTRHSSCYEVVATEGLPAVEIKVPSPAGEITALRSPATLELVRHIQVSGRVTDEMDAPVKEAQIAPGTFYVWRCDDKGEFRLDLHPKTFESAKKASSENTRFRVTAPRGSGLLSKNVDVPLNDVLTEKPINIRLERGIKLTGKLIADDGSPVVGVQVLVEPGKSRTETDENGEYELFVSKDAKKVYYVSKDFRYRLPSVRDVVRAQNAPMPNWLQSELDMSDGMPRKLEPVVIAKALPLVVTATLPGGTSAKGAEVIVKEEGRSPDPIESEETVRTGQDGTATLIFRGSPSDTSTVEVRLASKVGAFLGNAKLASAKDGVLALRLDRVWLVQGRILLDGNPVEGATVTIGESKTTPQKLPGGATVYGMTTSNEQIASTDAEGWYRIAAKTNGAYNVSIRSLPGDPQRPGIGHIPGLMSDKVLQADDFNLTEGFEEIAGVVVDGQGNPVVGAEVYASFRDNRSQLWYRHKASSKLTTDLWGRFHLKKVPEGIHQLRVSTPSVDGKRLKDVTVEAFSGDLEMRITLGN